MCHTKNSPPPLNHDRHVKLHQTRSMSLMKIIKEEGEEEGEEIKPAEKAPEKTKRAAARKSRKNKKSRRKKPKYLSLRSSRLSNRSDLVSSSAAAAAEADTEEVDADIKMTEAKTTTTSTRRPGQQLNLFPLHPELNAAEADHQSDDNNVALLFESHGGATLHGLLTSTDTPTTTTTSTMSSDHDQDESNYSSYAYRRGDDIVRTAMRGSGGDPSVEKWVCYSELVKEEVELTATTSSASTCCSVGDDRKSHQNQRLALKLDYTEVLNAWSDKGSLYIKTKDGEPPPQTVPDLLQDQLFQHLHDSSANIEELWRVPEEGGSGSGSLARKTQRQESLMRYKRKRQNRLFSKRIRYEVRKLNAEKRPRVKGRFVRNS